MFWQNLFMEQILDRGYEYFCKGAVRKLEFSNGIISAVVEGSEDYSVKIYLKNEEIHHMSCSCPYAEDGGRCKHMAAVLYKWEDEDIMNLEKYEEKYSEIEKVVNNSSEKEVKSFLIDLLKGDEKLFHKFKMIVIPDMTLRDLESYKIQISNVVENFLDMRGYINYYEMTEFICSMEEYLENDVQQMMDNKLYSEAFEISNYLFVQVSNANMYDSEIEKEEFAIQCMEVWKKIFQKTDKETRKVMFDWFTKHLDATVSDYMDCYIEQILKEDFCYGEYIPKLLKFTEDKLNEEKINDDESWHVSYKSSNYVLWHINLMKKSKFSEKEILEYCKANFKYSDVRNYYIDHCIEKENYDEAVKVLQKCIKEESGRWVVDYKIKLKDIYKIVGNEEEYKRELWELVTKDKAGDIELFKELKKIYNEEEWKEVREKIFLCLPKYVDVEELYKEEKLYDRLLEAVIAADGLHMLHLYEKDLKKLYPEEILKKYVDEVNKEAKNANNREKYRSLVYILKDIQKLKGGKKKVKEIAEEWRRVYKSRRAMMEELSKL